MDDGRFGCCPYVNGLCCDKFCCPEGSACGSDKNCVNPNATTTTTTPTTATSTSRIEPTATPQPPHQRRSQFDDHSFVALQSAFQRHLNFHDGSASFHHVKEWPGTLSPNSEEIVICPDQSFCHDGSTCCQTPQGYGCCPLLDATCCPGGRFCCPSGMSCGSTGCYL